MTKYTYRDTLHTDDILFYLKHNLDKEFYKIWDIIDSNWDTIPDLHILNKNINKIFNILWDSNKDYKAYINDDFDPDDMELTSSGKILFYNFYYFIKKIKGFLCYNILLSEWALLDTDGFHIFDIKDSLNDIFYKDFLSKNPLQIDGFLLLELDKDFPVNKEILSLLNINI